MMAEAIQNCPMCNCENFHPMPPKFEGEYELSGADYRIIIPFWCEEGCQGEMTYHHHEGTCYLNVESVIREGFR